MAGGWVACAGAMRVKMSSGNGAQRQRGAAPCGGKLWRRTLVQQQRGVATCGGETGERQAAHMCTDRTPTSTEKTSPQERNAVRGKVVLKYGKVKKLGVARGHTCVTVGMWVGGTSGGISTHVPPVGRRINLTGIHFRGRLDDGMPVPKVQSSHGRSR